MNVSKSLVNFFNNDQASQYDQKNSKLFPLMGCLHFLTSLILKDLPSNSKILCVGAGTGAEILALSQIYPKWTFVALDPSASMLDVCKERLKSANVLDRCELIHGYVHELPKEAKFDAAISMLVGHFVSHKTDFFRNMIERLCDGGYLINAEISFDLNSTEFPNMLKNWESVQTLMGATPESITTLPEQMKNVLTVLPPHDIEAHIRESGIALPVRFFQAFMICGWYGIKKGQ